MKIVSYWDDDTKKVRKYLLDCEASGGTSKNCADAINFSLSRLDADGFHVLLSGQCTDAGGGGVGQSLFVELKKVNRILDPNNYLLPTCSLHALQLVLSNPIIKCIGGTGLGIQTAPQLLHSLYNLCTGGGGTFEISEFQLMWRKKFDEKFKKITEPVLTRWWTVGAAAQEVKPNWEKWTAIAQQCVDAYPSISSANLCGSACTSMLAEPAIFAHICWIVAFHDAFWNNHFVWLSARDFVTGEPGFRTQEMAVRTLVMGRELEYLQNNWRESRHFDEYKIACEKVTNETDVQCLRSIETKFFEISIDTYRKHFTQWISPRLLPAMIGAERHSATMFASWLHEGKFCRPPQLIVDCFLIVF